MFLYDSCYSRVSLCKGVENGGPSGLGGGVRHLLAGRGEACAFKERQRESKELVKSWGVSSPSEKQEATYPHSYAGILNLLGTHKVIR